MLDARFSHLYFYQSLNRLQRGLSAIAELLVSHRLWKVMTFYHYSHLPTSSHVVYPVSYLN